MRAQRMGGLLLMALLCAAPCHATEATSASPAIAVFPQKVDASCHKGRAKLYDACGDQLALFAEALKYAVAHDKVLLVSYGADWCIWCHVFHAYIHGQSKSFTYSYGSPDEPDARTTSTLRERAKHDPAADAATLRGYVGNNFVIVHIDAQYAPNGSMVLERSGAAQHYDNWLPFLFSVSREGKFAGKITHDQVMVRRDGLIDWYRGYDRSKLLAALKALRHAGGTLVPPSADSSNE